VSRGSRERGAATVLATAFLGLLLLVGTALGVVVAMVAAHRQAQAAADLAALAAAGALQRGHDACGAAAHVAAANGTSLQDCLVDGTAVTVSVVATGPRFLGQTGDLDARARAGPGGAQGVASSSVLRSASALSSLADSSLSSLRSRRALSSRRVPYLRME
jgi:secretion/DNA translocation related TadE-like protein